MGRTWSHWVIGFQEKILLGPSPRFEQGWWVNWQKFQSFPGSEMYQNSTSERFIAIWGSLSRWCLICSSRARDAFLLAVITNSLTQEQTTWRERHNNYTTLEKHSVLPRIRRWTRWNSSVSRPKLCTVSSYRLCSQQTLTILKLRTHHIAFESHGRVAKNPGRRQMRQSPPLFLLQEIIPCDSHLSQYLPKFPLCGCAAVLHHSLSQIQAANKWIV